MNKETTRWESLVWGAMLGGTLGLMEAVVGTRWWMAFGRPDFLVRPHQVGLYAVGNFLAGLICGLVFGIIVGNIAKQQRSTINFRKLYVILLAVGLVIFVPLYGLILKTQIPLWFIGDIAIFGLGIMFARRMMNQTEHNQPSDRTR